MSNYTHLIADIEAAKAVDALPMPPAKIGVNTGRAIVEAAKRGAWLAVAKRARTAEMNAAEIYTAEQIDHELTQLDDVSTNALRDLALSIVGNA